MKKRVRGWMSLFLGVIILVMSGCGIRFTTGLSDNALFKLNKNVCEKPEAMVFVLSQKKTYETSYSADIWEVKTEKKTFETVMKDNLQDFLARMKAMVLMADYYGIAVTDEEQTRIEQAAAAYMSGIPEETAESSGITLEAAAESYYDYYLAGKVMEQLTSATNVEISEDEARVVQLQQIFLPDEDSVKSDAEKIQSQAAEGADFSSLAEKYNKADETDLSLYRGQVSEELENVVFSLSTGEISDVITTEDGYYIFRCISNYDEAATASHKQQMILERKDESFHNYYDEFLKTITAQYNEKAWKNLSYQKDYGEYTSDFYEIYNSYL